MLQSKFISNILELLLDGEEIINAKLQLEYLFESDYKYTDSGVFISFDHKIGIEKYKVNKNNLVLNGVGIKSTELETEAECLLFFKNGLIEYLEIWSPGNNYPRKELKNYELTQEWNNSSGRKIIVEKTSG
ncbi:hypothetical protein [Wenyingzhuangia sp. IMCC45467]